jgi:hypothetical protein
MDNIGSLDRLNVFVAYAYLLSLIVYTRTSGNQAIRSWITEYQDISKIINLILCYPGTLHPDILVT